MSYFINSTGGTHLPDQLNEIELTDASNGCRHKNEEKNVAEELKKFKIDSPFEVKTAISKIIGYVEKQNIKPV